MLVNAINVTQITIVFSTALTCWRSSARSKQTIRGCL